MANGEAPPPPRPSTEQIRALPKVELHAHLSGSISQEFLLEFMRRKGLETDGSGLPFDVAENLDGALSKCFRYFQSVAKVVTNLEALRLCSDHVLEAFAEDNCIYLEMRTTPKEFEVDDGAGGKRRTTKEEYVLTVLDSIKNFKAKQMEARKSPMMEVKLLLSVDRGTVKSLDDAQRLVRDVADLCERFPEEVVGIDICGNPANLSVEPFVLPALLELHEQRPGFFERFPITCHTAETPQQESETELVLSNLDRLNIRRLGHVNFLSEAHRQRLLRRWGGDPGRRIGIELCPTSNLVCMQQADRAKHHFPRWFRQLADPREGEPADKRPRTKEDLIGATLVSVNTDDVGLFATSLTKELQLLAETFHLSLEDLKELQRMGVESSFCRDKSPLWVVLGVQ